MHYLNSGPLFVSERGGRFATIGANSLPHLGACRARWQLPEVASYRSVSLQRRDSGFLERLSAQDASRAWRWEVATWRRVYRHLNLTSGEPWRVNV